MEDRMVCGCCGEKESEEETAEEETKEDSEE